jgi:tetratricopeptide (TPR) repeat protein
VNDLLLIGLLGAVVATNQPEPAGNLAAQTNAVSVSLSDANDPLEQEYHKLLTDDQAALDEVDGWIHDNKAFAEKGGGPPSAELNERILTRLAPVKKAYEDFLKRHPDHVRAHLAYGSFLQDSRNPDAAAAEFEKVRQMDPKNPVPWNQLANYYSEAGPVTKSFEYYAKAIELAPHQPIYYQNLASCIYLFRKDAGEFYKIDEQAVFSKALALYRQALKLDPNNFELAEDVAETYYGIKPTRTEDALIAWTNAMNLATNSYQKEGVYIHLARFKMNAGRFAEARANLSQITNTLYGELKARVLYNISLQERKFVETNAPSAAAEMKP